MRYVGKGGAPSLLDSMRRKQRSPAQIKQTKSLSLLQRVRSRPDDRYLRNALVEARANIRDITRLSKVAQDAAKREIHNARKREQHALRKAELAATEVEDLQARITELTAVRESEQQEVARELGTIKERHGETKKKLRQFRERLARVPSRLERAVQGAVKAQEQTSARQVKSPAGVVEDWARDLIRSLVIKLGVPVMKAPAVFLSVAQALGVNVEDTISDRTCRRIVLEGGVFAKTWLAKEISESTSPLHQSIEMNFELMYPHRFDNQWRFHNSSCNSIRVTSWHATLTVAR